MFLFLPWMVISKFGLLFGGPEMLALKQLDRSGIFGALVKSWRRVARVGNMKVRRYFSVTKCNVVDGGPLALTGGRFSIYSLTCGAFLVKGRFVSRRYGRRTFVRLLDPEYYSSPALFRRPKTQSSKHMSLK
jgi:hypothetical protein